MARIDTPSALMYARLKDWGISNRDAATLLLNTTLTFDGKTLRDRIDESSQLSRRIVHTQPGEIPLGLFNNFQTSCPQLERKIVTRMVSAKRARNDAEAVALLESELTGPCADIMMELLRAQGTDDSPYRNMLAYLEHLTLPQEEDRIVLQLMLFVITGCTGDPRTASTAVVDYATGVLDADFHTAQTVAAPTQSPRQDIDLLLGLVRIVNGRIEAGSQMHVLHPEGTEIGLMPTAQHTVTDVGPDASRRHALAWREGDRWLFRDLGSTNGTTVISGADGTERQVGSDPVELSASDIVCLGTTTRFIVMPVVGI